MLNLQNNSNNHQFQEKSEDINLVSLLDSFRSWDHLYLDKNNSPHRLPSLLQLEVNSLDEE